VADAGDDTGADADVPAAAPLAAAALVGTTAARLSVLAKERKVRIREML